MRSRCTLSLFLIILMLSQSFGLLADVPSVDAASSRGGSNDNFRVVSVEFGNATVSPDIWTNDDGTTQEYTFVGVTMPINVTVQRAGTSFNPKTVTVLLEAVHPIGFVDWSSTWNVSDMYGGQQDEKQLLWTPDAAHSELVNNTLQGGWILRATTYHPHDTINDDDVMDAQLPVAYDSDEMEGTDLSAGKMTFLSLGYPANNGDADSAGSWEDDNGGVVGSKHWRHSTPGSSYASGAAHHRLTRGFWPATAPQSGGCGVDASEPGAPAVYGYYYCRKQLYSVDYVSLDFHVRTYGRMAAGDEVSIELWRYGGVSIVKNLSDYQPSLSSAEWTNITWRPDSADLGGQTWSMGMHFTSDTSFADEGMHVDDWVIFAVEKVEGYTLTIDCDNPEGAYTGVPALTLSLYCEVTNNGYKTQTIEVNTNVSNATWMDPMNPQLRIDSSNQNQHGTSVIMNALPAGETTELWVNLSIPPGADVQSQVWNVWWEAYYGPEPHEEKGRLVMDVVVTEQYGVMLTSNVPLLAAELLPGETGSVAMRIQNSGNRQATFDLVPSFPTDHGVGWMATFVNDTGATFLPLTLERGEAFDFIVNVTAASDAPPGELSFSVRAACADCQTTVQGNDVLIRNVYVPELRIVDVVADLVQVEGEANGVTKSVFLDISNLGNDEEQYDLDLILSDWRVLAALSADETPVLEAWDGTTTLSLDFPMPIGLAPGLYSARVDVISVNDPTVYESVTISLEVYATAVPWVSDEDPEESYIPGDAAKSIQFEVRNDGNEADFFDLTFDLPDGMNAEYLGINDGRTTQIAPGASTNVTIQFSFDGDVGGQISLGVIATSVNDATRSSTGYAVFSVGSQNWLRLIAPDTITISEPTDNLEVLFVLRNQYTGVQSVDLSLDAGESSNYISVRIDQRDRTVVLDTSPPSDERIIHVSIDVSEMTLLNLGNETVEVSFLIWAKSNTVEDAQSSELTVVLNRMAVSSSEVEETKAGEGSGMVMKIIMWGTMSMIILALLAFLIRELFFEEVEEDALEGYESSISALYGGVQSAPDMDSFSVTGSSDGPMPLGPDPTLMGMPTGLPPQSKELPAISPTLVSAPAPTPAPTQVAEPEPAAAAVELPPPVPAEGLPAGWNMEQWNHYGAEWLRQRGRA